MFKHLFSKTLLIASFLCLSAHATSGFYGGLGLGGSHLSNKSNLHVNRLNGVVALPQNYNAKLADYNVSGEIFGGYGAVCNDFWLAAEVHFGLTNLETKAILDISGIDSRQPLSIHSKKGFGGAFLVGYPINPTAKAYVKVGFETRKMSTSFVATNTHGDPLVSHSKSFWSTAFVPGVGVETELSPSLTVRSEYRIAFHPEAEHKTRGTGIHVTALKTKPVVHHMVLGMYHKF